MDRPTDRPRQPFLDDDGHARVRTRLTSSGPVEHRPGQVILDLRRFGQGDVSPERVLETAGKVAGVELRADDVDLRQAKRSGFLRVRFDEDRTSDVMSVLARLRAEFGERAAAPNTVFTIGSMTADPMRFASGVGADPMRFASAYGADPMRFANSSTARPVEMPATLDAFPRLTKGPGRATVAILDTGFTPTGAAQTSDIDFVGPTGTIRERPDLNADSFLDIAAGHTTFIRTIVHRASPAAEVIVEGVIHNDGDGDEADVAVALARVVDAVADPTRLIVNLSFSGYYDDDQEPPMVAFWIRELVASGAVVVAAAGNNGTCRPKFPAAMSEVIAVASMGPCGPSWFSNHGSWVTACAPGEDLVSEFFADFDGGYEPVVADSVPDIDDFSGWARWSGTSFSTPAVVAALAELVETHDCPAQVAVRKLIGQSGLLRVPDYGVVVNRIF
jgi:subtilisin family serine protease